LLLILFITGWYPIGNEFSKSNNLLGRPNYHLDKYQSLNTNTIFKKVIILKFLKPDYGRLINEWSSIGYLKTYPYA